MGVDKRLSIPHSKKSTPITVIKYNHSRWRAQPLGATVWLQFSVNVFVDFGWFL